MTLGGGLQMGGIMDPSILRGRGGVYKNIFSEGMH